MQETQITIKFHQSDCNTACAEQKQMPSI